MKRSVLTLSCALAATTSFAYAGEAQNEDFEFLPSAFLLMSSDADRVVADVAFEGKILIEIIAPLPIVDPKFPVPWDVESSLTIQDIDPDMVWADDATLAGEHLSLLMWSDLEMRHTARVFNFGSGQWNEVLEVHDGGPVGSGFVVTDAALDGNEFISALANEDEDDPAAGSLLAFTFEDGYWLQSAEYDLALPETPSVDVGGGNWMRLPSSYSIQIEGDTMIVTEMASFIQDMTYTWLDYPILHTYHRGGNGNWSHDHSMRFQPGCPAEMMIDDGAVWVDIDFKGDRMILLRHESCTSMDYPWQSDEAIHEYTWNDAQSRWVMAGEPFELAEATQVVMRSSDQVFLLGPNGSISEYQRDGGSWNQAGLYAPEDPELIITQMTLTDSTLFASTDLNNDDMERGPILGFTLETAGNGPDIDGDGVVGVNDVLILIAEWNSVDSPADINGDGIVDVDDMLELLAAYEN